MLKLDFSRLFTVAIMLTVIPWRFEPRPRNRVCPYLPFHTGTWARPLADTIGKVNVTLRVGRVSSTKITLSSKYSFLYPNPRFKGACASYCVVLSHGIILDHREGTVQKHHTWLLSRLTTTTSAMHC